MIVDCGGGTVDVCVHQVIKSESNDFLLREEYVATGGKWGGIFVNELFINFLKTIFTENFINHIQVTCPTEWFELCTDFEYLKRQVKPDKKKEGILRIGYDIRKEHEKMYNNMTFSERISESQCKDITFKNDRLKIKHELVNSFIESQTDKIVTHLPDLFRSEGLAVNAIYKVGWFSNAPILSRAIDRFCSSKHITSFHPQTAAVAISFGAVIYGFNPKVITQRVSSFTYGIGHMSEVEPHEFVPDQHLYFNKDGIKHHKNLFTKAMRIHEKITESNSKFVTEYTPVEKDSEELHIAFFKSTKSEVEHVTDAGCEQFGEFTVPLGDPSKGYDRKIQVTLDFSGTEIFATGKDMQTCKMVHISLDFLSSVC